MHITDDDRESAITFSIKQGSAKAGDLFSQLEPRLSQPKSNVRIHLNTKRSSVVTWFEYEKGGDLQANSPPPPPSYKAYGKPYTPTGWPTSHRGVVRLKGKKPFMPH